MAIFRLFTTAALFLATICPGTMRAQLRGPGQSAPKPRFTIGIVSQGSEAKVGSQLQVDVTLTNTSNEGIQLEVGNGIGWEDSDYKLVLRDESGKDVQRKPPEALRIEDLHISSVHTTTISPGKTLKESLQVAPLYDLHPGKYTLQLQREDPRIKWVFNGTAVQVKHEGVGPNPVALSNTITITVIP